MLTCLPLQLLCLFFVVLLFLLLLLLLVAEQSHTESANDQTRWQASKQTQIDELELNFEAV